MTIQDEDIAGAADRTVRAVLECWSRRVGPVPYNDWQSVFFALIREHGLTDEGFIAGESAAERQRRIRDLYDEVLTAQYGPDFRDAVPARLSGTVPAALSPQRLSPVSEADEQGADAATAL